MKPVVYRQPILLGGRSKNEEKQSESWDDVLVKGI